MTNNTTSGFYLIDIGEIGLSIDGIKILDIVNDTFTSTVRIVCPEIDVSIASCGIVILSNGSVTSPSLVFSSSSNTGLYQISTNEIGVACNGSKILDISTSGLSLTGTLTIVMILS